LRVPFQEQARLLKRFEGPSSELLAGVEFDPWHEAELQEHLDIKIVDDVVTAFFAQHPIGVLMRHKSDFGTGGSLIRYKYDSLTWEGTARTRRAYCGAGQFADNLCVHISSDGFRYPSLKRSDIVDFVRHDHGDPVGWAVVRKEFIAERLPSIARIAEELGAVAQVLYNKRTQRIDIHFVDNDDHNTSTALLVLCLEAGGPVEIERDEYFHAYGLRSRKKPGSKKPVKKK